MVIKARYFLQEGREVPQNTKGPFLEKIKDTSKTFLFFFGNFIEDERKFPLKNK